MKQNLPSRSLLALLTTMTVMVLVDSTRPEPVPPAAFADPAWLSSPDTTGFPYLGATPAKNARVNLAIRRFEDAGLKLPPLLIVFGSSDADCGGARGLFRSSTEPWSITICSDDVDTVYEHELAHAWELANLKDVQRRHFMRFRGLTVWSDKEHAWSDRGVEWAAVLIQQGLSGLALPPVLGAEVILRLEGYEILTGNVAPILAEWLAMQEVPCAQRPTELSLHVPDLAGLVCHTGPTGTGTSRSLRTVL